MKDTTQDQLHAFWLRIWVLMRKLLTELDGDKVRDAINNQKNPFWEKLAEAFAMLLPTVTGVLTTQKKIRINLEINNKGAFVDIPTGSTSGNPQELPDAQTLPKSKSYNFVQPTRSATMRDVVNSILGIESRGDWQENLHNLPHARMWPSEIRCVMTYIVQQLESQENWPYGCGMNFFSFVSLNDGRISIVQIEYVVSSKRFNVSLFRHSLEEDLKYILDAHYIRGHSTNPPVLVLPCSKN